MADDFFTKVKKAARKEGVKGTSASAQKFFQQKVRSLGRSTTPGKLLKGRPDLLVSKRQIQIGKMYFFFYDAKTKSTLPFWDRFPLIFVLNARGTSSGSGFLGLNLHYLPPKDRAILLGQLISIDESKRFDETTKLNLSYNAVKNFSKSRPAIKRYLNAHVKSRFLLVPADDWLPAVFLPVAQWEKASAQQVYADSRKKMR